ncbi:unnamed protein product [Pleuronectes platessa]|uniref:Uncharacterized protein n=1 Tax=Pleuronectes platessa TaxID=8262 RepID=A0A9N7UUT2_PLEPL|nr:unnamed protein product [Pleuronectes platessa]
MGEETCGPGGFGSTSLGPIKYHPWRGCTAVHNADDEPITPKQIVPGDQSASPSITPWIRYICAHVSWALVSGLCVGETLEEDSKGESHVGGSSETHRNISACTAVGASRLAAEHHHDPQHTCGDGSGGDKLTGRCSFSSDGSRKQHPPGPWCSVRLQHGQFAVSLGAGSLSNSCPSLFNSPRERLGLWFSSQGSAQGQPAACSVYPAVPKR